WPAPWRWARVAPPPSPPPAIPRTGLTGRRGGRPRRECAPGCRIDRPSVDEHAVGGVRVEPGGGHRDHETAPGRMDRGVHGAGGHGDDVACGGLEDCVTDPEVNRTLEDRHDLVVGLVDVRFQPATRGDVDHAGAGTLGVPDPGEEQAAVRGGVLTTDLLGMGNGVAHRPPGYRAGLSADPGPGL